jgi:hypothetical protein
VLNIVTATPGLNTTEVAEKVRDVGVGFQRSDIGDAAQRLIDQGHLHGVRDARSQEVLPDLQPLRRAKVIRQ